MNETERSESLSTVNQAEAAGGESIDLLTGESEEVAEQADADEWEPRRLNRAERRKQLRDARRALGKINARRTRQDQALLIKIRDQARRHSGDPEQANRLVMEIVTRINQQRAAERSTVS